MGRSGTRCRSRCSIPVAPPARHREKAGKLYLPAVQRMGSEHVIDGLYPNLEEVQGLRSGRTVRQALATRQGSQTNVQPSTPLQKLAHAKSCWILKPSVGTKRSREVRTIHARKTQLKALHSTRYLSILR